MNKKLAPPIGRLTRGGRIVLLTIAVVVALILAKNWIEIQIYFNPEWARSIGLLGPITEESEELREFDGYIYVNFELINFGLCKDYRESSFGEYPVHRGASVVMNYIRESALAVGKDYKRGFTIYIRFIGKRTWLRNAGFGEGYRSFYTTKVDIFEALDMQPMKDQCSGRR